MAINWRFDEGDCKPYIPYKPIEPGKYWVRIEKAEEMISKAGHQMIKLTLEIDGKRERVWSYIVFDMRNKEMVNRKLNEIYESFRIKKGDLDASHWVGYVGAVQIKQNIYEGQPVPHVSHFLNQMQQENLPPWRTF